MSETLTPLQVLKSVLVAIATSASMGAAYPSWRDKFARKEVKEEWTNTVRGRTWSTPVTVEDLQAIPLSSLYDLGFKRWAADGRLLVPLWAYGHLKKGEVLTDINGRTDTVGSDTLDLDVRVGCIAYGFEHPELKEKEDATA